MWRKEKSFSSEKCAKTADETNVSHESTAAQVLDHPHAASDLGPAAIDSLEAIDVCRSGRNAFLELVGVDHHGERVVLESAPKIMSVLLYSLRGNQ